MAKDRTMVKTKAFAISSVLFLSIAGPNLASYIEIKPLICIAVALIQLSFLFLADDLQ